MTYKTERQSNFELLRIISMYMIVLHHLVNHGVIQGIKGEAFSSLWLTGTKLNQFSVWLFFPGGEVGVALFFMISGFFLIKSEKVKLLKVVSQTIFYSLVTVLIYIIVILLSKRNCFLSIYDYMEKKQQINNLVFNIFAPIRSGQFWFVSAYIFLLLIMPVYNMFLRKLNNRGFVIYILFFWFFGFVFGRYFNILLGYTQACLYYAIGALFKLWCSPKKLKKTEKGFIICIMCISWILYAIVKYKFENTDLLGIRKSIINLITFFLPSCIFVIICSVCIFYLFMNLNIKNNLFINAISSTTFGVYLIHEGCFTRIIIWDCLLRTYDSLYQSSYFPILSIFCALLVFLCCSGIDYLRQKFIEPPLFKLYGLFSENIKKKLFIGETN